MNQFQINAENKLFEGIAKELDKFALKLDKEKIEGTVIGRMQINVIMFIIVTFITESTNPMSCLQDLVMRIIYMSLGKIRPEDSTTH